MSSSRGGPDCPIHLLGGVNRATDDDGRGKGRARAEVAVEKFESARSNRRRIRRVDGVHDLGGLDGFGPVEHTASEPYFDEHWERRMFRVLIGSMGWMGGAGGRFRHSIERMAP